MSDCNSDGGSIISGTEFLSESFTPIVIPDVATAHRLIDGNPTRKYRKENDELRRKKKNYKDGLEERRPLVKAAITEWLVSLQGFPGCFDKYHGKFRQCNCLANMNVALVSKMLIDFSEQEKGIRDTIIKTSINNAEERLLRKRKLNKKRKLEELPLEVKQPPYVFDIGLGDGNPRVCIFSFRNAFGYFKTEWQTLKSDAKAGNVGPLPKKNIGNKNRTKNRTQVLLKTNEVTLLK